MILYFSGTGNSRFAARRIAEITGDTVLDAAEYIRKNTGAELVSEKPWVFVAPVYVSAPPLGFMDFLKKSRFSGSSKAYFVMTCAGTMSASPVYCSQIAREKCLDYMGTAQLVLPQNYIAFFRMKTAEENRQILQAALPRIDALAGSIAGEQPFPDAPVKGWEVVSTRMVLKPYYRWFIRTKKFCTDERCIGCGKCARVCPLGNIRMENGLPRWGESCTHCMACINLCPKDAIEYGKGSVGKVRYRGPEEILK